MILYPTIIKYLARRFTWYLFLISLILVAILFISNAFDTLQKFKSTYITPEDFWLLIVLKIPFLFNEISAIIGFISTLLFLRYLSSSNELVTIIGNGVVVWRIFAVPIIVSFFFGIAIITIINPIGTFGLREYEKIEAKLNNTPQNIFIISKSGIFFYEKYHSTNRIIQAKSINTAKKSIADITILVVDEQNNLIKRIDSTRATLDNGLFELKDPLVSTQAGISSPPTILLPTNLSIDNLIQRFSPPEMISIWQLPESIDKINNSGLPILNYQLHFFKQLFKPLAMSAMVLLACWFLTLNNRDNSSVKNIVFSLAAGLGTYFLLEIMLHVLTYGGLGPIFATSLPILFIILISNFVILHFQEA
jgi:lipopolysaccharide export system permease protein